MLDATETLDELAALLGRLPETELLGREISGSIATLHLRVRGAEAVRTLQGLSLAANVPIEPQIRDPESDIEVEQVLIARMQPVDVLELGYLQMLGINTVWRLHKVGLTSAVEANSYLVRWRGALVGA